MCLAKAEVKSLDVKNPGFPGESSIDMYLVRTDLRAEIRANLTNEA